MQIEVQQTGVRVEDWAAGLSPAVKRAAQVIMGRVRAESKTWMRAYIASRLTPRASYLITDTIYEDGLVGYLHSRWFRGARGGKVTRSELSANDILAAHSTPGGLVIRAVRAKGLLISGARGRTQRFILRRSLRRDMQRSAFGGNEQLEQIQTGRGGVALVKRRGKGRGETLATVADSVRIPQRLDMDMAKKQIRQLMLMSFSRLPQEVEKARG